MSFFGLNAAHSNDRGHPTQAPGFTSAPDPFASLSQNRGPEDDEDEAIDFEDTYDGLGDQLEEANDDFNDDTFGGGITASTAASNTVGKDFDFFGQTAKVSEAINEEQLRFSRQAAPLKTSERPAQATAKPYRTGYESYKNPNYLSDLQVNASLWGTAPTNQASTAKDQPSKGKIAFDSTSSRPQNSAASSTRKMMSLDEVEAAMRTQAKKPNPAAESQERVQERAQAQPPLDSHHPGTYNIQKRPPPTMGLSLNQSRGQQAAQYEPRSSQPFQVELPAGAVSTNPLGNATNIAQRDQRHAENRDPLQPRQILQNPNRQPAQLTPRQSEPVQSFQIQPPVSSTGLFGQSQAFPIITHPQQLMHLSEEDRRAFLVEDAKRAKRNHKIYLLSKDNGLMTPQDKNFITRIQLQQLMTTTGSINEQDPDASLSEDFYYQVHNQIRGGLRQSPHQPLNNFAQTYLFQTGSRHGSVGRRYNRGGDNHMQRMEQQVQRAVEAAKQKSKSKQLVIEGSLGKISFSNAKTPKPLLNIKKQDSSDNVKRPTSAGRTGGFKKFPQSNISMSDRRSILKIIEEVYSILMLMEDLERRLPSLINEGNPGLDQQQEEWRSTMQNLNQKLWSNLKVLEPIVQDSPVLHPFIAFLSYPKGKKAIPRIFRHIDQEQRLTILTIILVHLNVLDVIRFAQPQSREARPSANAREEVELFCQAVMPSLFGYINEAPLDIVTGLLGIILNHASMSRVARSKVGLDILTTLISRAEIVKQAEESDENEWDHWLSLYSRLFDTVEPLLGDIFPGSVHSDQDVYVWQFLAATGIGASLEQQRRLVLAVKDRVLETVAQSKTLPPEMASQRLGTVNLFMRAIGLDVDQLG
ncbi:MAG: hypothetical protein Q9214_001535 [Letrouitia sp. 1 TL-2023]